MTFEAHLQVAVVDFAVVVAFLVPDSSHNKVTLQMSADT